MVNLYDGWIVFLDNIKTDFLKKKIQRHTLR